MVAALAVLVLGAPAAVRAEVVYELSPVVSLGVTDNALAAPDAAVTVNGTPTPVAPTREKDLFASVSVGGRVRFRGARSTDAFGLRLTHTQFLTQTDGDNNSGDLAWMSTRNLSATLDLRVGATASIARASGIDPANPTTIVLQGAIPGTRYYLNTSAVQELDYAPSARQGYIEGLTFGQIYYLEGGAPTTAAALRLRGNWFFARDTFSLEATVTDAYTSQGPAALPNLAGQGNIFMAQVLAGWRRELSLMWAAEIQAGPAVLFLPAGEVVFPAGRLAIDFRRAPWFASVEVAQTPVPNLYLGRSTVNDQALARLILPLTERELVFISGVAGYIYARSGDDQLKLVGFYHQRTVSASLTARMERRPFAGSIEYTLVDQRASDAINADLTLFRQTLMLSILGVFVWGPGTPALVRGVL